MPQTQPVAKPPACLPRLAVLKGGRDRRQNHLTLLVRLHTRMHQILKVYTNVAEAIVRQVQGAA